MDAQNYAELNEHLEAIAKILYKEYKVLLKKDLLLRLKVLRGKGCSAYISQ